MGENKVGRPKLQYPKRIISGRVSKENKQFVEDIKNKLNCSRSSVINKALFYMRVKINKEVINENDIPDPSRKRDIQNDI